MEKIERHRPSSRDVDLALRYRPNEIMNYLADLAARHAEEIGFGYYDMDARGMFWVVHRFLLEIKSPPLLGRELECISRPWFRKGLKADRQFILTDGGVELLRAHSLWLLVSKESRRPLPLHRHFEIVGEPLFEDDLSYRGPELMPGERQAGRTVAYSDVDMHGHCNNSRYVSWCLDCFEAGFWEHNYPRTMDVLFQRESFAGDDIDIYIQSSGRHYRFDGMRENDTIFTYYMTLSD